MGRGKGLRPSSWATTVTYAGRVATVGFRRVILAFGSPRLGSEVAEGASEQPFPQPKTQEFSQIYSDCSSHFYPPPSAREMPSPGATGGGMASFTTATVHSMAVSPHHPNPSPSPALAAPAATSPHLQ